MSSLVKKAGLFNQPTKTNLKSYESIVSRCNGMTAAMYSKLASMWPLSWFFVSRIKDSIGLTDLMSYTIQDEPMSYVEKFYETNDECPKIPPNFELIEKLLELDCDTSPYLNLSDFYHAYRSNKTTPTQVCENVVNLANSQKIKELNAILEMHEDDIRNAAEQSTARFKSGQPLSPIDGIPFFAKDQFPVEGYTTLYGVAHLVDRPSTCTCNVVKKLQEAGAIFMGITNMTYGCLNIIGFNPSKKHGATLNPFNKNFYCGGSSNGSAAVVSCGLVPFSLGNDGYGSNRIPPSLTGMVGLKATKSRINSGGTLYVKASSVAIGPITNCVRDSAIIYSILAGPDNDDPHSLRQPPPIVPTLTYNMSTLIETVRIGYDDSFSRTAKDPSIIRAIYSVMNWFRTSGFKVIDYCVPEINEINAACMSFFIRDGTLSVAKNFGKDALDAKLDCSYANVIYTLGKNITDEEYEQTQRQRTRAQDIVNDMFQNFDIFITPSTGVLAPLIHENDESNGVLDEVNTHKLLQFCALPSCAGNPALTIYVGSNEDNLPIGIQLQAAWWHEDVLYEMAHLIENHIVDSKKSPKVHVTPF